MSKGYSIDLRERVLGSLDAGMSKMTAHLLFRISRPTIDRWIALREQTGSLAPRALPPTRVRQLQGAAFEEFAQRHAHATRTPHWARWRRHGMRKEVCL